jgi:chitinase
MKHTRRNILKQASALSALAVGASATASAADCSSTGDWDSSTTYTGGDQAVYDGSLWEASWWTRGDEPGSSQWGPWEEIGPCNGGSDGGDGSDGSDGSDGGDGGTGNCSGISAWDSSATYTGGEQVVYDNAIYEASWWTSGDEPGASQWGPWEMVEECSGDGSDGGNDGGDSNLDAVINASSTRVHPGDEVTLDASDSTGDIESYEWYVGDNGPISGAENSLTLDELGTYTVELTVTDADGNSDTATTELKVVEKPDSPDDEFKVIGYYPSWKANEDQDYYPEDIPWNKVTDVQFAFVGVDPEAADTRILGEDDPQLLEKFKELKQGPASDTRVKPSIGGWADSDGISDVAASESKRQTFADNCVEFIRKYDMDGIDLDWEHPGTKQGQCECGKVEDYENHVKLMQAIRDALDAAEEEDGQKYWLSVANGGSDWNAAGLKHGKIGDVCDYTMIMAYDFTGLWAVNSSTSMGAGLNAPIYQDDHPSEDSSYGSSSDTQYAIQYAVDMLYTGDHVGNEEGLAGDAYWPDKGNVGGWTDYQREPAEYEELVLGLPFYGRGHKNVSELYDNPYYTNADKLMPKGTWDHLAEDSPPTGAFDFGDLEENYIGTDGWEKEVHPEGEVPILWNRDKETYISYDDEDSIQKKIEFAKERGLQGVMFWELSQDWNETLLDTINETA